MNRTSALSIVCDAPREVIGDAVRTAIVAQTKAARR